MDEEKCNSLSEATLRLGIKTCPAGTPSETAFPVLFRTSDSVASLSGVTLPQRFNHEAQSLSQRAQGLFEAGFPDLPRRDSFGISAGQPELMAPVNEVSVSIRYCFMKLRSQFPGQAVRGT